MECAFSEILSIRAIPLILSKKLELVIRGGESAG